MDDLISRQAAIDLIHKTIYGFFDVVDDESEEPINEKDKLLLEVNKAISNGIKELPTSPRWTPVSEGLPKKDDVDVLVTDDSGGYATIGIDCMFTRLSGKREWLASQRVTAWMPAPTPYKERSR